MIIIIDGSMLSSAWVAVMQKNYEFQKSAD